MAQGRTNMEPRCHRGYRAPNQGRILDHHVHVTSAVPQAFLGRFSDEKLKFSKFSNFKKILIKIPRYRICLLAYVLEVKEVLEEGTEFLRKPI